jgi:hypothetical protein
MVVVRSSLTQSSQFQPVTAASLVATPTGKKLLSHVRLETGTGLEFGSWRESGKSIPVHVQLFFTIPVFYSSFKIVSHSHLPNFYLQEMQKLDIHSCM